jgi:hypothetical protein
MSDRDETLDEALVNAHGEPKPELLQRFGWGSADINFVEPSDEPEPKPVAESVAYAEFRERVNQRLDDAWKGYP